MSTHFTVEKPDLSTIDLVKINLYAKHEGVQAIIDHTNRKYIIIRDGVPGYVQKHNNRLFVAFKNGRYDNIDKIACIANAFLVYNICPEDELFNFQGICNWVNHAHTQ